MLSTMEVVDLGSRITEERAKRLGLARLIDLARAETRTFLSDLGSYTQLHGVNGGPTDSICRDLQEKRLFQFLDEVPMIIGWVHSSNTRKFPEFTVLRWTGWRHRGAKLVALDEGRLVLLRYSRRDIHFGSRQQACYMGLGVGHASATPVRYWAPIGLIDRRSA